MAFQKKKRLLLAVILLCNIMYITGMYSSLDIFEGTLEVKLPTIWTDGKAELGRVREEKRRREKIRAEKE